MRQAALQPDAARGWNLLPSYPRQASIAMRRNAIPSRTAFGNLADGLSAGATHTFAASDTDHLNPTCNSLMTSAVSTARRSLHFRSFGDLLDEVRDLSQAPRRTLGRWSDAQIVEHLAIGMEMSFDGYGFQAPWFVRTAAHLVKNRILTGRMPSGVRLPRRGAAMLPSPGSSWEAAVERLQRVVARFAAETPTHPHPVLGRLTRMEYELLHLRHAELHLGFIVPHPA